MYKMEKTNNLLKQILPIVFIGILAFVFSMVFMNTLWYKGDTNTDSSVFIYVARVILNDGMPYKDTFDHKGPLIYLINVLGILISEWRGIYVVELISLFISFVYIYKIARLKLDEKFSLIVLIIVSSVLFDYFKECNYTEEYALPFLICSLFIFIDYFENNKINVFRLIICGLCFGAVCLLRFNMIAMWMVMCFGVIVNEIKNNRIKELLKYIGWFFVGFGIIVLPICAWLISRGAFQAFIDNYFIFNFNYTKYVSNDGGTGIGLRLSSIVRSMITFLNVPVVLFSIAINIFFIVKNKNNLHIINLIYIVINFILICMGGRNYLHYGIIIIPSMIYPWVYFFVELLQNNKLFTFCAVSYLLITFAIPPYFGAATKGAKDFVNRNSAFFTKDTVEIVDIIKNNTTENDKITVIGNRNVIYNLSNRFASSKYSYQFNSALDEAKMNEFFVELETNMPKLIIVVLDYNEKDGRVDAFIEKHQYKKILDKKSNGKINYTIYER